jgi:hypothetical protein
MPLLQNLYSYLGTRLRPRRNVVVETAEDLVEFAHWIERPPLRMLVPPHLLRMQGGFVYGTTHPFVAAVNEGEPALRRFHALHQPRSICDYYGLRGDNRTGCDLPPWEIPWYGRSVRTPPPGELDLGPEHGVSFYGPVSDEKIALELRRLTGLRDAIERNGYDPDAYGDIEGYILSDGVGATFFIRGGKHRAAVLTARGEKRIPVAFRSSFPRLIHSADCTRWPLVRSGAMDFSLAKEILDVYIGGRD